MATSIFLACYRHYPMTETAKDIVILHGWGSTPQKWQQVAEKLRQQGYRLHIIDLPGFGETPLTQAWSLEEYVQFVLNWLKTNNIKKVILLGHSFGGRIAIKLASAHDSRIERLILISAAGIKPKSLWYQARGLFFKIIAKIGKKIMVLVPLGRLENIAERVIYKLAGSSDYRKASPLMKQTLQKVIAEDLEPLLSFITVPTLLIWGEQDRYTPLSDGQLMHKMIPMNKLIVLPNIGHSPHLEAFEILIHPIIDFLKKDRYREI